jgi:hypothetical protein
MVDGHHRPERAEHSHSDKKHFNDAANLIAALVIAAVLIIVGSLVAAAIMR